MSQPAGTVRRYIIKKAMILVAPIEEKVEVVLASDYDRLAAQAVALATAIAKSRYDYWKRMADYADDPTDHATIHADLMAFDDLYKQAQALLDAQGRKG